MPPQRTMPPARPVKTERTHEENQERAYIAASRRSDRSLEARIESARRASEIHKRRTGRSLRVTEQDVINEEMYEEEDDDLPSQYRRLTAHLQTNSTAFNQRLAAYLTGQVGVRSAIDQYITNSYAQQFPNAQQFPQNQPSPMYQNPGMAQQFQQQMMQSTSSPTSMYRQAPYPMPGFHHRPSAGMHGRAASIANPQMLSNNKATQSPTLPHDDKRRSSSLAASASVKMEPLPEQKHTPTLHVSKTSDAASASTPQAQTQGSAEARPLQPLPPHYGNASSSTSFNPDFSLFTTALPAESQMLLGSALDPRDPMTSMFMAGSQYMPSSYYNFDSSLPPTYNVGKDAASHGLFGGGGGGYGRNAFDGLGGFDGLNTTLAPSDLDLNSGEQGDYADQTSFFDAAMKETVGEKGLGGGGTPGGNGDFNLFIDQEQWGETPIGSQQ